MTQSQRQSEIHDARSFQLFFHQRAIIDDLWDAGCKSEDTLVMGRHLRMWGSRLESPGSVG